MYDRYIASRDKIQPAAPVKNSRHEIQIGPSIILSILMDGTCRKKTSPATQGLFYKGHLKPCNEDMLCPITVPFPNTN